jgi:hypothetical protein
MNTSTTTFLKTVSCGAAAVVVTMILSWSFVHSTAVAHVGGGMPAVMLVTAQVVSHLG